MTPDESKNINECVEKDIREAGHIVYSVALRKMPGVEQSQDELKMLLPMAVEVAKMIAAERQSRELIGELQDIQRTLTDMRVE